MTRAGSVLFPLLLAALAMSDAAPATAQTASASREVRLEWLGIPAAPGESRAVSYTNKRSAYFYTLTDGARHPEHGWFRGLNIAGRRVFNDVQLIAGGTALNPASASSVIYPDALVRTYPGGVRETLRLFDDRDVVEIAVEGAPGVQLRLSGDQLRGDWADGGVTRYVSTSGEGDRAIVDHVATAWRDGRFLIAVDSTAGAARALLDDASAHSPRWREERRARMRALISEDHGLSSSDQTLNRALLWIVLTTDQLVTRQRGDGIYAGLPWFNEYWGRDEFISLPGAALVTGHFEQARAILRSFAQFQDLDPSSAFFGRMPNIVKPGSIDYHTTDGTPRWVIALRDYVDYSGDRSIIPELFPNVAASIEGAFARFTDADGYLAHADNETWMDARREPDKASYSPRATRANDIQALWYQQLRAAAEFATAVGDTVRAARWTAAADRVRERFARDFVDAPGGRIADRLDAEGRPDFTLRPNFFFALDLVADPAAAARATRRGWEALAYPWGVATLDPANAFFHPYHLAWEHYHKDEAYHNGTVWLWLNGIAMQRMIERGQVEPAWAMFQAQNRLALTRGAAGGLPETMDAFPHPGEALPRLTGTFLQAWSNAEHLRVWYQHFLGVRPRMASGSITLAPRVPGELPRVEFGARVGSGTLRGTYTRSGDARRYTWTVDGVGASLSLDIAPFPVRSFSASPGDQLIVDVRGDVLQARLLSPSGQARETVTLPPSAARQADQMRLDAILAGTRFATPGRAEDHPVMRQTYQRQ